MRGTRRGALVVVLVAVLVGLPCAVAALVALRIGAVFAGTPQPAELLPAQVRFLDSALRHGAAEDMQGLFPEGYFFSHVLTGLAAAATTEPGQQAGTALVERELAALDSDAGRAPFAAVSSPPGGAFWTGWSLLLQVELARLRPGPAGSSTTADAVRRRAGPLLAALRASPTGFLESYPGQRWPVDNVVAVA